MVCNVSQQTSSQDPAHMSSAQAVTPRYATPCQDPHLSPELFIG